MLALCPCASESASYSADYITRVATESCYEPTQSLHEDAGHGEVTITIDHTPDTITLELPSIACPLTATADGDDYVFDDRDCDAGRYDERDIHGTATEAGGELMIDLTSIELWPPLADPTARPLVATCEHTYALVPVD